MTCHSGWTEMKDLRGGADGLVAYEMSTHGEGGDGAFSYFGEAPGGDAAVGRGYIGGDGPDIPPGKAGDVEGAYLGVGEVVGGEGDEAGLDADSIGGEGLGEWAGDDALGGVVGFGEDLDGGHFCNVTRTRFYGVFPPVGLALKILWWMCGVLNIRRRSAKWTPASQVMGGCGTVGWSDGPVTRCRPSDRSDSVSDL